MSFTVLPGDVTCEPPNANWNRKKNVKITDVCIVVFATALILTDWKPARES